MLSKILRKLIFPNSYSSPAYIKYLKKQGIEVGEGTIVYSPNQTYIDLQRPHLLKIGKYCKITRGVTILSHDYSKSVLRRAFGENIGEAKSTQIGDNVFIGNNAIILMGSKIGNNSIVAAGAVVTGVFEDNVIIAGNPAKAIMDLNSYYLKRKSLTINEAIVFAKEFYKKWGYLPNIEEMGNGFAWLYLERSQKSVEKYSSFFQLGGDDTSEVISDFLNTEPQFKNFDEFIIKVKQELKNDQVIN